MVDVGEVSGTEEFWDAAEAVAVLASLRRPRDRDGPRLGPGG
ncbi:hypothetical protein [Streptomyces sp. NPDC088757]